MAERRYPHPLDPSPLEESLLTQIDDLRRHHDYENGDLRAQIASLTAQLAKSREALTHSLDALRRLADAVLNDNGDDAAVMTLQSAHNNARDILEESK